MFNDTATTEIYTLSLHDALPISREADWTPWRAAQPPWPIDHFALSRYTVLRRSGVQGRQGSAGADRRRESRDRKSTRLNSSHANISYAVFCLKKKLVCRMHVQMP